MGEFEEKLPSLLGERLKTVFKNLVQMHRSFTAWSDSVQFDQDISQTMEAIYGYSLPPFAVGLTFL